MTRKEHTLTIDPDVMLKHWLLNLAVEFPVGLVELFPNYQWGRRNIKELPGSDRYDYVRGLLGLFDSGLIKLTSEVDGYDAESRADLVRFLDELLKLANVNLNDSYTARRQRRLRPDMQVFYQLTATGGEVWERLAEPDWSRYLDASVHSESGVHHRGDVLSPNRDLIMAYMGWCHEIRGDVQRIQSEAITWQTHSSFEILYWKRLPLVHHASFLAKTIEDAQRESRWPEQDWLSEWYDSAITWYKHPWELEGWPNEGNT